MPGWDKRRQLISRFANRVARLVIKVDLKDPMSGFFLMRRQAFDEVGSSISPSRDSKFFSICSLLRLDLCALRSCHINSVRAPMERASSTAWLAWEYGMLLADKLFGQFIPPRFVLFAVIGGLGLLVHLMALAVALYGGLAFTASQTIATF